MATTIPKVLHKIGGKTVLSRTTEALYKAGVDKVCVVVSRDHKEFQPFVAANPHIYFCIQNLRNGTAGAVASCDCVFEGISPPSYASGKLLKGSQISPPVKLLITPGDLPFVNSDDLHEFINEGMLNTRAPLGMVAMTPPNPQGYGRVSLDQKGFVKDIVEETDASTQEKKINLCNSGVIFADCEKLFSLLQKIDNKNSQKEYYLTDVMRLAAKQNTPGFVKTASNWKDFIGINTQAQLEQAKEMFEQ